MNEKQRLRWTRFNSAFYMYCRDHTDKMLELISVGEACGVRTNIDRYYKGYGYEQPTYFFDWLMTKFDSVNELLVCDPDDVFNRQNIRFEKDVETNKDHVIFSCFTYMVSIHDKISADSVEADYTQFIQKYVRRYERLISRIKSIDKPIVFIHFGVVTPDQVSTFFANVERITSHQQHGHRLLIVNDVKNRDEDEEAERDNVVYVYRPDYRHINVSPTWDQNEYDWNAIINVMDR